MMTLARRYRFSASHRLHSPELSDAANSRVYGKCNNPFGHGHDYVLEIAVTGPVDPRTGLIISTSALDRFVRLHILQLFANRNINADLPQFARLVATTENIALVIAGLIQQHWAASFGAIPARVQRVHVQETRRNGFEVILPAAAGKSQARIGAERILVHG
ncbi:MAG TPA: 6-carboxytetrahydropterin synthase [Bryobacteraceae bacterium]|nr:6-carboxytetrahydropterin synthase [Bryobacteraceae bacterium]